MCKKSGLDGRRFETNWPCISWLHAISPLNDREPVRCGQESFTNDKLHRVRARFLLLLTQKIRYYVMCQKGRWPLHVLRANPRCFAIPKVHRVF